MIPKIIHYCWFGHGKKSKLIKKCIKSWKKYCPDYEIIEWNEENFNISYSPQYVQDAYKEKRWAFVSDYARLWIVYNYGGIYLDTDVEIIKKIDNVLNKKAFFAFSGQNNINTGIGFGAEAKHPIVKSMMDEYSDLSFFLEDGSLNTLTCVFINSHHLENYGFVMNNQFQEIDGCAVYPMEYFCPKTYSTYKPQITENTYSIHWYNLSWKTEENKKNHINEIRKDYYMHLPNKIIKKIIGDKTYESIKSKIKK